MIIEINLKKVHLVNPYYTTHTFIHMHTVSLSLRGWTIIYTVICQATSTCQLAKKKEKKRKKNCTIWRA